MKILLGQYAKYVGKLIREERGFTLKKGSIKSEKEQLILAVLELATRTNTIQAKIDKIYEASK